MKLSLAWLAEFVDLGPRSAEDIARDLTLRTALIEGIERRGEGFEGVVVGRVLEKKRHPDADRLAVCTVLVGDDAREIVCGAPNVAAGQFVPVAVVGAVLPGDFRIRKSRIRGVESNGMICSPKELGLGEDHDGILVLEDGLEVGMPFRDVPGVVDAVLEIDNKSITHRPDLWSHEGFARELAAIHDQPFRAAETRDELRTGAAPVTISLEAEDLCGRYAALGVSGALGTTSPGLVRRRLEACGLRALNLGVDLTNYLMLEIGQPTHLFDRARLRGGTIRVRRSGEGETLRTLDGLERVLPAGLCVIADAVGPVALAGVMGGEDSKTTAETEHAVLESAFFDPQAVRRASAATNLRTDASARFEKFLDPAQAERGARRFAALATRFAPQLRMDPTYALAGRGEQEVLGVALRPERVRAKLGIDLDAESMAGALRRLGFGVDTAGDGLAVRVPSFRATRDVRTEDDLIEEIGRIAGYDRIEPALPRVACAPVRLEPVLAAARRASELLRDSFGFAETLSYAFLDDRIAARARSPSDAPYLRLRNPLQQGAARLRRSLVPALLEFVDRNVRVVEDVRLFECGRVFLAERTRDGLPAEPHALAAVLAERVTRKGEGGRVLRRLKGVLEETCRGLGIGVSCVPWDGEAPGHAHPGRIARLTAGGHAIGALAQVHPDVADAFGWRGEAAVFEFDLDGALEGERWTSSYVPPPKYPDVRIDLSFVAPFALDYASLVAGLRREAALLRDVDLVDEYLGGGLAAGTRSLTLRFTFRADDRTLGDAEVGDEVARLKAWLATQGAALRG